MTAVTVPCRGEQASVAELPCKLCSLAGHPFPRAQETNCTTKYPLAALHVVMIVMAVVDLALAKPQEAVINRDFAGKRRILQVSVGSYFFGFNVTRHREIYLEPGNTGKAE